MDFVGYNDCRAGVFGTSTKAFCEENQAVQLELNKKWFLESELGRLRMLKYTQ